MYIHHHHPQNDTQAPQPTAPTARHTPPPCTRPWRSTSSRPACGSSRPVSSSTPPGPFGSHPYVYNMYIFSEYICMRSPKKYTHTHESNRPPLTPQNKTPNKTTTTHSEPWPRRPSGRASPSSSPPGAATTTRCSSWQCICPTLPC